MGRAIAAISGSAAGLLPGPLVRLRDAMLRHAEQIGRQLFSDYHPERHYMRGPGPKWRAKHGKPTQG